jgi:DNA mismatch repair protein MutL
MAIKLLDQATIGKIAAGEVIERPASVVKELVENALDAGARAVRVEIVAGGRDLIRVRDDGSGIDPTDLPVALQHHATSKLRSFDDLATLRSYGFRGEALASIAAVSDLEIVSRPTGSGHATRVRSRHGQLGRIEAAPASPGTTISVRDLFANVPVRRRFLRQDATEAGYVHRVVAASALAFPEVRFELTMDGKTALATDGSGDLGNAIVGVLGAEIAAEMIPIQPVVEETDGRKSGIMVSGYIGLPTLTRGNRQQIILLVNRRWIESRQLAFALEQAYHTLVMVGRYPVAVVHLDLPPDRVDVNVHPTKREVRFSDERLVFASLQRAVRGTLLQHTPSQSVPDMVESPLTTPAIQRRLSLAHPGRFRPTAPQPVPNGSQQAGDAASPTAPAEPDTPILRVLGQVGVTYIIAEGPDGMYLIDQHAAHERILLEKLLALYERAAPESQAMLEPLVLELAPRQLEVLEQCDEGLGQLGFQLESFGGNAIAIRAVPAVLSRRDPKAALLVILDEVAGGGRENAELEALAISTACHSAIRAGEALSLTEMREMLVQLEQCASPRFCGHGRPTMLHLSQGDLERQFSRR